jgi:hypothetical protein
VRFIFLSCTNAYQGRKETGRAVLFT